MRRLVIECASEACSVALFDDASRIARYHEVLGRGHAERLVPAISELPGRGRADKIAVSLGPGSFTGTRIGIAAARALGLAWRVPVEGFPTLALLAAQAQARGLGDPLGIVMNAGHGEWLVQAFGETGRPVANHVSAKPEKAIEIVSARNIAGNRAEEFVERRGFGEAHPIMPDTGYFPHLPRDLLTDKVSALYARPPDAKPAKR